MLDSIWELGQQWQINSIRNEAESIKRGVERGQTNVREELLFTQQKLDRLAIITRALFELMQKSGPIPEEELAKKIIEIDLRDGKADGKMTPQPIPCPECKAIMSPRFKRCFFCGYRAQESNPFDAVK